MGTAYAGFIELHTNEVISSKAEIGINISSSRKNSSDAAGWRKRAGLVYRRRWIRVKLIVGTAAKSDVGASDIQGIGIAGERDGINVIDVHIVGARIHNSDATEVVGGNAEKDIRATSTHINGGETRGSDVGAAELGNFISRRLNIASAGRSDGPQRPSNP